MPHLRQHCWSSISQRARTQALESSMAFLYLRLDCFVYVKKKKNLCMNSLILKEQNAAYFIFQYSLCRSSRKQVAFASWALSLAMDAGHCRTAKDRTGLPLPSFHAVAERNAFQQTIQISNLKHLHLGGRFPSSHSSSQSQLIAPNLVFSFRVDFIKPPAYFTAHMLCQLSLHNAKLKAVTYSKIKASFESGLYRSHFCKLLRQILTINSRGDPKR